MRARRRPDLPSTNPTTTHVGDSPPCPLPLIANAIANAIAHACGSSIVLTRPRHHRGAASTFAASRHRCHHRCLLRQIVVTYVRNFTGWLLALAPWRHGGWRHFVLPSAIPRAAPPARQVAGLPSTNPTTTHVGDSPPCPLPLTHAQKRPLSDRVFLLFFLAFGLWKHPIIQGVSILSIVPIALSSAQIHTQGIGIIAKTSQNIHSTKANAIANAIAKATSTPSPKPSPKPSPVQ